MNRTQKGAWFTFGIAILLLAFGAIIFTSMFTPGEKTAGTKLIKVWIWIILAFMAGGAAFAHWKRIPSEVDCDERDKLIEKNAHLAGFGAVYLLVILVSYLPIGIAPEAKIPTKWFTFLFPIAVLCQCLVMSLATLIQYGWESKGEQR